MERQRWLDSFSAEVEQLLLPTSRWRPRPPGLREAGLLAGTLGVDVDLG